ncbi:hypothetical protein KBD61_06035 [Patescibacteria group bacterium]|nr:hypothetical protein [Patescibacteria group bacterium]MBP9710547.1 hypothetical protein [Patescibacteria group bacterium]
MSRSLFALVLVLTLISSCVEVEDVTGEFTPGTYQLVCIAVHADSGGPRQRGPRIPMTATLTGEPSRMGASNRFSTTITTTNAHASLPEIERLRAERRARGEAVQGLPSVLCERAENFVPSLGDPTELIEVRDYKTGVVLDGMLVAAPTTAGETPHVSWRSSFYSSSRPGVVGWRVPDRSPLN